jgi:hypothetical protein
MSTTTTTEADKPVAPQQAGDMCIIDLGQHPRKRIQKLRKGEGRLMEKVEDALQTLRQQDVLGAAAQTVVVIVRQEMDWRSLFEDDDDEDEDDDD